MNIFVPQLLSNLLLVDQSCDLRVDVHFSFAGCTVQDQQTHQSLGYVIKSDVCSFEFSTTAVSTLKIVKPTLLGLLYSPSLSWLEQLVDSSQLGRISSPHFNLCLAKWENKLLFYFLLVVLLLLYLLI